MSYPCKNAHVVASSSYYHKSNCVWNANCSMLTADGEDDDSCHHLVSSSRILTATRHHTHHDTRNENAVEK
eukprot:scaffold20497_cov51-Attheya_sp.AAC.4